jgi:hypothetical protein
MTYTEPKSSTFRVFDHATTEAVVGDVFHLPYQPSVRIIAAVDSGDYVCYVVQSGSEKPEQWDILKPEAELREQERNRVEAEALEAEIEMSAIIHGASQEEIESAIFSLMPLEYDWLACRSNDIEPAFDRYAPPNPAVEVVEISPWLETEKGELYKLSAYRVTDENGIHDVILDSRGAVICNCPEHRHSGACEHSELVKEQWQAFWLYLQSLPGEHQADILPLTGNAYHDSQWTSEGCEF